jgi:uncharacterized protein with PIN domain
MIRFRFYAELNDFLPKELRMREFPYSCNGRQSIKHLIEAIGVPHTEVDLILINGASADFSHIPGDGDRVSVYPVFEALDITPLSRIRQRPLRRIRFILDSHLGRLAVCLRMLGFDTLYRNDYRDDELVHISLAEHRIILTSDRNLLMRAAITHGHFVRQTNWRVQLIDLLRHFDLAGSVSPLSRCLVCNEPLETVAKEDVATQVPPLSREFCNEFRKCSGCGRLFWNGSHHHRMIEFIDGILKAAE